MASSVPVPATPPQAHHGPHAPAATRLLGATRWWTAGVVLSAVLLGLHAWRAYAPLRDAVPDPVRELPAAGVPLGPTPIVATIFVPDCATALVVRFDPASAPHGEMTVRIARQLPGNRFAETPQFHATARLESMPDGVWTLHPPMEPLRARFVQITLQPAADARGAILMRAPASRGRARPNLDQRWGSRPSVIAGALTARGDPLACVAAGEPLPRALVLPGVLFLGMVWGLTLVVIVMWLWPRRTPLRPPSSTRPAAAS